MCGYLGKVLVINLTDRSHRCEPVPEAALRRFIGGVGPGSYLLYRNCPPGADSLGPIIP